MIDDLSDVVADLADGTYIVTRSVAPTFVNGIVAPDPAPTTFPITASVQPASGNDLKRLPEGDRDSDVITLYTATALRTSKAGVSSADVVAYLGQDYQVEHVDPWAQVAGYCKAIARRVGQ